MNIVEQPVSELLKPVQRYGVKLTNEADMPAAVALSPEEEARNLAAERSPAVQAEFQAAIDAERDPGKRAVLQASYEQDFGPGVPQTSANQRTPAAKPPTWEEVLQMPEMQNLSGEALEAARHQYFVDVVAPQVPTDQLAAARAAFDADTRPGPVRRAIQKTAGVLDVIRSGVRLSPETLDQLERSYRGLKQSVFTLGLASSKKALDVMDRIDRGETVLEADDPMGYQHLTPEQRQKLRANITETHRGTLGTIAKEEAEQRGLYHNPAAQEAITAANEGRWGDAWQAFASDPGGAIKDLSVSNLAQMVPMAVGGTVGALVKGIPGFLIGVSTGSFPVDYAMSLTDYLRDAGVDVTDPAAVDAKLSEPDFMQKMERYANLHASAVTAADAASARLMVPFRRGAGVARNLGVAGRNLGVEITGEMAGEAAGQAAGGEGPIKWGDVIAEGLAAGPQAAAFTAARTIAATGVKAPSGEKEKPKPEAPPADQGPLKAEDILGAPDTGERAPTVAELTGGTATPAKENPRERLATINRLLGDIAASSNRDTEQSRQHAAELIAERAQLEAEINPDVDVGRLQRQNRDRSRAAMVGQMQSIANAPDYDRLGPAPIPDVGAPMVSIAQDKQDAIPPTDFGKKAVVTLADGTKMPVRYAVVEADSVLASHDVGGRENKAYFADPAPGELRALTNGRVAGLIEAYNRNTAADYAKRLAEDADSHGVPAAAIEGKKRPMLVRVYDDAYNRIPRLAQLSNTGGSAKLSPAEQAQSDAALIDTLDDFQPGEAGEIDTGANTRFINRFIQRVPESERGELQDAKGRRLTQLGATRIRNAIFAKAYGAGDVLLRMVESTDNNIRNVTAGLMRAADKVAKLREDVRAGALHDLDITEDLIGAVESFSRLRAEGKPVSTWLAQANIFGDDVPQEAVELMTFLEANSRSGKRIAQFLENYLNGVRALGSPAQEGMFEQPLPSRAALIREAQKGLTDDTGASEEGLSGSAQGVQQTGAGSAPAVAAASDGAAPATRVAAQGPGETIDAAAHEAATSPANDLPEPTTKEKKDGDYPKGRFSVSGINTAIENPAGSIRRGTNRHGDKWEVEMKAHYGEVEGTEGIDGDPVDIFWKPGTPTDWTGTFYVVNQNNRAGKMDEHKVMGGYDSLEEARAAYLENYTAGWESRMRSIAPMPMEEFRAWVYDKSDQGPKGGEAKPRGEGVGKTPATPEDRPQNDGALENQPLEEDALQAELQEALADLGEWVDKNLVPKAAMLDDNAEQNLLPILTRLFSVAIKKGARDFAGASKLVMAEVRKKAAHLADLLNERLLRRAYRDAGGTDEAGRDAKLQVGDSVKWRDDAGRTVTAEVLKAPDGAGFMEVRVTDPGRTKLRQDQRLNQHINNVEKIAAGGQAAPSAASSASEREGESVMSPREGPSAAGTQDLFASSNTSTRPPSGVDTARATTAPQRAGPSKTSVFTVGAIDDSTKRIITQPSDRVEELMTLAKASQDELRASLDAIGQAIDAANVTTRVKARPRIDEKLAEGRPAQTISDYLGGRIRVKTRPDLKAALQALRARYKLIEEDDFTATGRKGGYRAIHVQAVLDSGLSAEVQIVPAQVGLAQDALHVIYDDYRVIKGDFSPEVRERIKLMVQGYRAAWEDFEAGRPWRGLTPEEQAAVEESRRVVEGRQKADNEGASKEDTDDARRTGQRQLSVAEPAGRGEARDRAAGGAKRGSAGVADRGQMGLGLTEQGAPDGGQRDADREPQGTGEARKPDVERRPRERPESGRAGQRDSAEPRHSPATLEPSNYVITERDQLGGGGLKTKAKQNLAAIGLVKQLAGESRRATPEEQAVLVKYVGWGGLKGVFDERNDEWAKERAELKDLLTADEYEAARRSVLDAHFTSATVVKAIYDALTRFGFTGGRALEPGAGSGNFLGLTPDALRGRVKFTAVELDPITGAIAKQLYQQADVVAPRGFQEVNIPEGYFDVALGNPPFGSQSIVDKENPDISKFSIHNFFFAKSIKSLRPGGVLGMVVSNFFMDARNRSARTWIAQRAKLIGAIRLPNTAFLKNANTEVTTDIVFLQKRDKPITKEEARKEPWVTVGEVKDEATGEPIPLNPYFIEHPDMMLGKMTLEGTMYSKGNATLSPNPGEDLDDALPRAIAKLPENIYSPLERDAEDLTPSADAIVPETVKVGGLFVTPDGKIARRTPDVLDKPQFAPYEAPNARAGERIRGMVKVRDALRNLMRAELADAADDVIARRRSALNRVYDDFVRKQGYINSLANRRAFEDDPDLPLLEALESDYDAGISRDVAKKEGVEPRAPSAKKAAIFRQRVLSPHASVKAVDSAADALSASLNQRGRVDFEYMAQVYGRAPEQIKSELAGLIYEDPDAGWVTADAYLSGNVKAKLAQAKAAAAKDARFAINVEALERVQPPDVPPTGISVRLGSGWVPANHVADFIHSLLGVRPRALSHQPSTGGWMIDLPYQNNTAFNDTWGAKTDEPVSWGADKIIAAVMNQKPIVVRKNIGTREQPNYIVLERETDAAMAKAEAIAQKFRDWVWEDKARRDELARLYNDRFNTDRLRTFDGSHLTLPGTNPTIKLTPHKRHSVWRIIQNPNTLLDHVVGSGKTFTTAAAFMELRRLGLVRKPMVVVPNHIVRQWRDEWYALYPNANILATTEKDFEKGNRQRLFARIATGDWDAVIVAHSSFGKIGMPAAEMREILHEQVVDITSAIDELKRTNGDRFTIRQMEQAKARIEEKMQRAESRTGAKDLVLNFAELGIDALAVDEAHEFKNLFYYSQMRNVAGLGNPEGSGKAFDLFLKVRYLQQRRGRVLFATGTPISNSLVEMFTLQRYLDYDGLKARGIAHLDSWAGVYADIMRVWETHPSGNGYRLATRFARFVNLPELITQYRKFADVVTQQDMFDMAAKEGKRYPIPRIEGGKPKLHVAGRSPEQTAFFGVPQFVRDEAGRIRFKVQGAREDFVMPTEPDEKDGLYYVRYKKGGYKWGQGATTAEEAIATFEAEFNTPLVQYNQGSILWKYENLRQLTKDTHGRINALSITNEARKAGLDYRLIDPNAADFSQSKVNKAIGEIIRIYHQWKADRGAQLVFIDLSTPKGWKAPKSEQTVDEETGEVVLDMDEIEASRSAFSVYDAMKAQLIAQGIPEREIAFIHDTHTAEQKKKLFGRVNRGEVRILFGSTKKMGAGTNVQRRLVGEHHLDAPWRPSDLEQREGRILRQGNSLYERDPDGFRVEIHRYATEKTYDTRMWQIIEHKAAGIEQLRRGQLEGREMEDISGEAANAAEMKAAASGNPLIAEEIQLRDRLKKLENIFESHRASRFQLEGRIAMLEEAPARAKAQREGFQELIAARKAKPKEGIEFTTADGKRITESKGLLDPAARAFKAAVTARRGTPERLGAYRGFNLWVERGMWEGSFNVLASPSLLPSQAFTITTYGPEDKFSPSGFVQRLDNFLDDFESRIAMIDKEVQRAADELKKARAELAKPFDQMKELEDTRKRHREVAIELQRQGGAIELSPEMQAELEEARKARGKGGDTALSRFSREGIGRMTREDANAVANLFRERFKGLPPVHVAQSVREAPPALRTDIRELGAEHDTAGAWHKGEIWLFADNLRGPEHAAWVILHESTHHGLRGMFGTDLDPVLMAMYMNNARVRAETKALQAANPKLPTVRAVEEVLANMGGDNLPRPVWERLVTFVRRVMRRLGVRLDLTDADIRDLVARALRFVKRKPDRTRIMAGTALGPASKLSRSGVADERPGIAGRALRPGEPFIVYRVGDEASLDNRNGGNAESVARHIASFDDFEAPSGPAIGSTIAAFEVTVEGGFGAYEGLRGGRSSGNKVGRVVRNGEVAYSFPKGAKYSARLIAQVPLADVRRYLELRGNAYGSFDEAGVREGAAAIRMVLGGGGETALSRSATRAARLPAPRGGVLDTALRIPVQVLGIDRATGWVYDRLLEKVGGFIPEKVKAGVVADYAIPEAVIDRRDRMFGRMRRATRQTQNVLTRLTSLTRAESRIAYDWMTSNTPGDDALLEQLPEDSRQVMRDLKGLIDSLGQEAVRLGQLSADAYDRNKLAYLHRSYRKFEVGLTEGERTTRARAIRILGDQYKGRGMVNETSMDRVKNAAPEWWRRKLKEGKADRGLRGEEFIRFERRTGRGAGVGVLPGIEEANNRGRLLEVEYWPASEPVPQKYGTWERDGGVWQVRDVKGGKLVLWRDFTREEQTRMGVIDEVRFAVAKTLHQMVHDIEVGRYLEWLANTQAKPELPRGAALVDASESMVSAFAPDTWVQVPAGEIPGTGVKRYGKLAGLFVPGPIWNDIRQVVRASYQPLGETYGKLLRAWKISKTALSPAVHMNNVMANVVMADWHDVRAQHIVRALAALTRQDKDPVAKQLVEVFEDMGGLHGSFSISELQREQMKPLLEALEREVNTAGEAHGLVGVLAAFDLLKSGKLREAWDAAGQGKAAGAVKKVAGSMMDLYQFEDTVFRLAAFIKAKDEGATDEQAGKTARKSFLDYHINAPWIQMMRATAFPFIAFTYRAAPMLLETAARKPWKLLKLGLVMGVANWLGYMLSGGDEDKERKLLPEEKSGRIFGALGPKLIRMPWNDQHGSPVFLDIRRWIPVGDIFDLGQTHTAVPVLPFAIPGGPLAVMAELIANRSQFTGREITKGTDTAMEKAGKIADHLYKAFAPNILLLPGTYAFKAVANAGTGRTDPFGREQSVTMAIASSVGVKLAAYPADVAKQGIMLDREAKIREIGENIGQLRRELIRKGITREQFDQRLADQIEKRRKVNEEARDRLR